MKLFSPQKKKIGLVLSGGGARGLAHLGVIRILKDNNIPLHCIVGTSSGALIGLVVASGLDFDFILRTSRKLSWKDFSRVTLSHHGFVSSDAIEKFIHKYIQAKNFNELEIPFACVACDLKKGERIVFQEGDVAKAVRASCSFPVIYLPLQLGDQCLVDGGLVDNLPVEVARKMGANIIIAVDVMPRIKLEKIPTSPIAIFERSIEILMINQTELKRKNIDFFITPVTEEISFLALDKANELIEMGQIAGGKVIRQIKKKIGKS